MRWCVAPTTAKNRGSGAVAGFIGARYGGMHATDPNQWYSFAVGNTRVIPLGLHDFQKRPPLIAQLVDLSYVT